MVFNNDLVHSNTDPRISTLRVMAKIIREVSLYYRILATYIRKPKTGDLIWISGRFKCDIKSRWNDYWQPRITHQWNSRQLEPTGIDRHTFDIPSPPAGGDDHGDGTAPGESLQICECRLPDEAQVRGIVKLGNKSRDLFEEWFICLVLSGFRIAGLDKASPPTRDQQALTQARIITSLFSQTLRNRLPLHDRWELGGGRAYFEERILFSTARQSRIDFVLPAFPCKSPSKEKVAGTSPDKGEELALRSLFAFVKDIEAVYQPGAQVLVVSDGHVFSDCVGVDDSEADLYGAQLIAMSNALFGKESDRIAFLGLGALLRLADLDNAILPGEEETQRPPMDTVRTVEAEGCRRVLIAACGISARALREEIETSNPATLALYRGFSKFVQQDLSAHVSVKSMSGKQRQKMAKLVAFEMLLRNQAYSNLLELLFPTYVRLSIHWYDFF